MNTQPCTNCHAQFPQSATFCPFCGAGVSEAPFNKTLVGNLLREPTPDETMMMEPIEDFRPGRSHGLKLLVGVAATAAVGCGIWAGSWLSEVAHPREVAAPAPVAQAVESPASEKVAIVPEVAVSPNAHGGFDILRGAEIVHTVSTSSGSRYPNLDERMRSVAVRFKHIAHRQNGRFAARLVGDHYELVWADDSGDFRLLDITEQDVKAKDTNPDFVANFLSDRLNADLPRPHNS